MASRRTQCPKCDGNMEQGFVPDFAHGAIVVSSWHAGQPKKSFWRKTKVTFKEGLPLGAFRCSSCGFLEFYADPRFAAE